MMAQTYKGPLIQFVEKICVLELAQVSLSSPPFYVTCSYKCLAITEVSLLELGSLRSERKQVVAIALVGSLQLGGFFHVSHAAFPCSFPMQYH